MRKPGSSGSKRAIWWKNETECPQILDGTYVAARLYADDRQYGLSRADLPLRRGACGTYACMLSCGQLCTHSDCLNHTTDLDTSCGCGVVHSRAEDLYTASPSSERNEKSAAVVDLPYALPTETLLALQNLPVRELIFEHPVLLYGTFAAPTVGLRAPPVFV